MTTPSPFAGTWHMQSWTSLKNGEPAGYPMGEDAQGQIVYADDGYMCAFLMRADFPQGKEGPTGDTCLSYGGSWHFEDGKILLACNGFLRWGHRADYIKCYKTFWIEEMKLPELPEAPEPAE